MKIQKLVAVVAIAGLASATTSIAPASAHGYHWASPWPAVTVMVGVVGVMTNAAYVWRTQCRELSSQEAVTSTFLPFVGMAFDAQASKCR
ncbi:MAG: hypothetical protein ABSF67_10790 [Roseiarcus sp.]|jgi:hypothetical protein